MSSNNRNAGRAAILNAPPGEPSNDLNSDGRFEMRPDGLFRRSDDGRPWRVSGPFEVLCETHDDEALAWGLLIRFPDRDQVTQCVVVTRDLFAGEGAELRGLLARRGLFVNPTQAARGALNLYLATLATPKRARVVARTGWHRVGDVRVFVLPDEVFGHAPVEVLYQPASRELSPFRQAGSLAAWRDDVASWCIGNSRLLLAVSAAFAAPLLDVVGEEGGGLHLRGASRIGKTTALRVAASVWGGNVGGGAEAYLRQWRSTSNATEGVAATHSDTLLALDELGQADPREVGATAYMLASGQGKNRMDRAGALRAVARFRSLFLSTGELSLGDKIAEAGSAMKAGQEVRLVDLPADAGAGLGLFEQLHGETTAIALIDQLRNATGANYGTAAPAFLRYLVKRLADEPQFPQWLRDWISGLARDWMLNSEEAGGQVRNVARRFALVGVAGELATMADVTGWPPGDAAAAAETCFRVWLDARGSLRAREDLQAVAQLRAFIARHGDSRFADWREAPSPDPAQQSDHVPGPPIERFRTVNRAGWRRWMPDGDQQGTWRYYLTAEGMGEAMVGLDRREAHKVLIDAGYLLPGKDGKAAGSHRPPGHAQVRLYEVTSSILGSAAGDA